MQHISQKSFQFFVGKVRVMEGQATGIEYQGTHKGMPLLYDGAESEAEYSRGIPLWVPWNGLLIVLLLLFLLSGCGTMTLAQQASVHPVSKATSTSHTTTSVAPPARLIIRVISVNARVESVGQLPDGNLATPPQSPWEDVGWFSSGPNPGTKGSAVIDGHLDRPGGYPAVFWKLRSLHPGDSVQVIDTSGVLHRFQVTLVALYPPQEAPLQGIFGNEQDTYLNLITCAGDWIPSEHQTTLRLVVYTKAVK